MWLLLVLLIAGAASYTYGSRYAIVPGHGPVQTAGDHGAGGVPPQPEAAAVQPEAAAVQPEAQAAAGLAAAPVSAGQAVHVIHRAGPAVEPEELEKDERNKAPRGQPAPVRTGEVDPPSLAHRDAGDGILSSIVPPEPELPALTVVDLSISRT